MLRSLSRVMLPGPIYLPSNNRKIGMKTRETCVEEVVSRLETSGIGSADVDGRSQSFQKLASECRSFCLPSMPFKAADIPKTAAKAWQRQGKCISDVAQKA